MKSNEEYRKFHANPSAYSLHPPKRVSEMGNLRLEGFAGDPIWLMGDGQEPFVIGMRLDCGDSGVVYLTRDQARDLKSQLGWMLEELEKIGELTGQNGS